MSCSILLIGDSLTEGYSQYGLVFHSYAQTLQELLNKAGIDVSVGKLVEKKVAVRTKKLKLFSHEKIVQKGASGERVYTGTMQQRLQKYLAARREIGNKVDWVIIMAG